MIFFKVYKFLNQGLSSLLLKPEKNEEKKAQRVQFEVLKFQLLNVFVFFSKFQR